MTAMPITVGELKSRIEKDPLWPTLSERMREHLPVGSVIGGGWVLSKILGFETKDIDIFIPDDMVRPVSFFHRQNIATNFFGRPVYSVISYPPDLQTSYLFEDVLDGNKVQLVFCPNISFDITACEIFVNADLEITGSGLKDFVLTKHTNSNITLRYSRIMKYLRRGVPVKTGTKLKITKTPVNERRAYGIEIAISGVEGYNTESIMLAEPPDFEIKYV